MESILTGRDKNVGSLDRYLWWRDPLERIPLWEIAQAAALTVSSIDPRGSAGLVHTPFAVPGFGLGGAPLGRHTDNVSRVHTSHKLVVTGVVARSEASNT